MCKTEEQSNDLLVNLRSHGYNDGFFDISGDYGFLPKVASLERLPEKYASIQKVIDEMPIVRKLADGSTVPGLLAGGTKDGNKMPAAVAEIPNFKDTVEAETDKLLIHALYRAYTFIGSALVLEPSNRHLIDTGDYGKASNFLPANIAQPLCVVAKKLDVYPFLDYHYAYSLGNWAKRDPKGDMSWDNLEMLCKFSGDRDEHGFVMLHVDINQHSAAMIKSIHEALEAIEARDSKALCQALKANYNAMIEINKRRKIMWEASRWKHYNDFRVFIMGSKDNKPIFGDGVVYENTETGTDPRAYRGESGSQDDLIPTEDTFTGVINFYPDTVLTKFLLDMRSYRPKVVQRFLEDLKHKCVSMMDHCKEIGGTEALTWLLAIVDQIHDFRNGHWMFVQKYIMPNTKYTYATGGTPVTTWVPNQMIAVLTYMGKLIEEINAIQKCEKSTAGCSAEVAALLTAIRDKHPKKVQILNNQMAAVQNPDFDPKAVYESNGEFKEHDFSKEEDSPKRCPVSGQAAKGISCPMGH